jgi:xylulokinase
VYTSLYDYLCDVVSRVPAGSGGVVFTPWFHGNRCPFEDENARGMFFNISLNTGKSMLIRSVIEGICYHSRWMLEAQRRLVHTSDTVLFVGGGASSPVTCQILADVLGCEVATVEDPQNVGAVGAAVVIAVGMKLISGFDDAAALVPVSRRFRPNAEHKAVHDRNFKVFKTLYRNNKKSFGILNSGSC